MLALIHNTVVSKMPIIKYICQHTLDARRVPLFTTRRLWLALFPAPSARLYAIDVQKSGDVVQRFCACGV